MKKEIRYVEKFGDNEVVVTAEIVEEENVDEDVAEEENGVCYICGKTMEYGDEYAYAGKDEVRIGEFEEIVFCSRRCWREFLIREVEEYSL